MNRERAKELLPIIQAYAEGKKLQYKVVGYDDWHDVDDEDGINEGTRYEYRIKPEEPKTRRMTYRQLAEWLAKGNGQQTSIECSVRYTFQEVVKEEENKEVPADYRIRYWNSDDWIEPTYDVYAEDCMHVIQTVYD